MKKFSNASVFPALLCEKSEMHIFYQLEKKMWLNELFTIIEIALDKKPIRNMNFDFSLLSPMSYGCTALYDMAISPGQINCLIILFSVWSGIKYCIALAFILFDQQHTFKQLLVLGVWISVSFPSNKNTAFSHPLANVQNC